MANTPKNLAEVAQLQFDYIKSNFFRVVYADGAHGGYTPRGNFHMVFFNERLAIPQSTTHAIVDGQLGPEIDRVARQAIVREAEVDVVMNLQVAESLHVWLGKTIAEMKSEIEASQKGST